MTKTKELKREIEVIVDAFPLTEQQRDGLAYDIRDLVERIVESVPMKEIKVDDKNVGKDIPRDTSFWNVNEKICWKDGFNYHTKNVKQWKQEILKQLK